MGMASGLPALADSYWVSLMILSTGGLGDLDFSGAVGARMDGRSTTAPAAARRAAELLLDAQRSARGSLAPSSQARAQTQAPRDAVGWSFHL
jgi:hypothetical protein